MLILLSNLCHNESSFPFSFTFSRIQLRRVKAVNMEPDTDYGSVPEAKFNAREEQVSHACSERKEESHAVQLTDEGVITANPRGPVIPRDPCSMCQSELASL